MRRQPRQVRVPIRRRGLELSLPPRTKGFCREGNLRQAKRLFVRTGWWSTPLLVALGMGLASPAQQSSASDDKTLADSVQELRLQVQQLQEAVAEIKSEASQYRAESDELRKELENLRSTTPATSSAESAAPASSQTTDQRLASLEEATQVLQSENKTLYQSKVESASKYRARISGLVLLNLFDNHGHVDNADVPTYAANSSAYGANSVFGATLRQSEVGLEVFGPEIKGAKTSGAVQFDFGGGFPAGALDGINTGIVRLRTAAVRLDWEHTSVVAGQDNLFISPLNPTSFASLLTPSFGYAGNLWAWTPQLRVERRFDLSDSQNFLLQAGILDNVTGEPSVSSTHRQPQAGESSGLPAYAFRLGWNDSSKGRPMGLGVSGYYSRQDWGNDWNVDGWATAADWRIPFSSNVELSGELYRGRGIGGLGGGIGQSILFSGNPLAPGFRSVDSAGGWSQLKVIATSRLEFNGVFGMDNPFGADIRALPAPIGYYPSVLTANRSEMANFVYRPRSDILFSGEYRHLRTNQIGGLNTADQVNMVMGVLF